MDSIKKYEDVSKMIPKLSQLNYVESHSRTNHLFLGMHRTNVRKSSSCCIIVSEWSNLSLEAVKVKKINCIFGRMVFEISQNWLSASHLKIQLPLCTGSSEFNRNCNMMPVVMSYVLMESKCSVYGNKQLFLHATSQCHKMKDISTFL